MELSKLNKQELLELAEKQQAELTKKDEQIAQLSANADKDQQIADLKALVQELNNELALTAKAAPNAPPTGKVTVDGKLVTVRVNHGVRHRGTDYSAKEVVKHPEILQRLVEKKSTAVTVLDA